jgi:hypothetical protein
MTDKKIEVLMVNPQIDPELIEKEIVTSIVDGSQTTYQTVICSNPSNSITWTTFLTREYYLNRCIPRSTQLQMDFIGTTTAPSGLLLSEGYSAFRSLPIYRSEQSNSYQLGKVSVPLSQPQLAYPEIMLHYLKTMRNVDPLCVIDPMQNYTSSYGGINNPLSSAQLSEAFTEGGFKRGAYHVNSITRTATTARIIVTFNDFIFIPGLLGPELGNAPGITGITDFKFQTTLDFGTNCSNLWSQIPPPGPGGNILPPYGPCPDTITSIRAIVIGTPTIWLKIISPPNGAKPNYPIRYPFYEWDTLPTVASNIPLNPGQTARITAQASSFTQVPLQYFSWVGNAINDKSIYTTDTFCQYTNQAVTFDNNPNINSTADEKILWLQSKDNGLIDGESLYQSSITTSGGQQVGPCIGPYCLRFGEQIPLGPNLQINSSGVFKWNTSTTFKNVNESLPLNNPTLYAVVVYPRFFVVQESGICTIETPSVIPNTFSYQGGVTEGMGGIIKIPYLFGATLGGNTTEKGWWQKITDWLKENKVISKLATNLAPIASVYGVPTGITNAIVNKIIDSGYGGKTMTNDDLRRAIKNL